MKKCVFFFLLLSFEAMALDAVVKVLEAPLFKEKSLDSPIVQYVRKGDVIKIHPSVGRDTSFDRYAPSPEKMAEIQKKIRLNTNIQDDPLFPKNERPASLSDEFIPTQDRQGNTVYILSEHLYVYFGDSREFGQRTAKKDPTDYRLQEPLPRKYPLMTPTGYRGQFLLGLNQPYTKSYPYERNIKTKGYSSPVDVNVTLLRQAPGSYQERLFFGGSINVRSFKNSYLFEDNHEAKETAFRFGIGPTLAYDAYKGVKNRINLSTTIIINLIDRMSIAQTSGNNTDSRLYSAYSIVPRLALQYHRKEILEDIDFVLGTAMEVGTSTSYKAKNAGSQESWWQNLANDEYKTGVTYTLGAYIGIQSAY